MPKSVAGTIADPTVPFTKLILDEQEYSLVLDFNALAEAEKETGLNLLGGLASFFSGTAAAKEYRGLLYAALRKAQPDTTLEGAGALCDMFNLPDIRVALMKAYRESLPEKKRARIAITEAEPDEAP
jgi:hypothetical protein